MTGGKLFPCFILRGKSINNMSLRNISEAFFRCIGLAIYEDRLVKLIIMQISVINRSG
jgi:hypothetical protein